MRDWLVRSDAGGLHEGESMITVNQMLWLIRLLFFVSGATALIDQMAWQSLLVLFAGGDVGALTLIVAVFMFRLGVGNTFGGHLAERLSPRANEAGLGTGNLLKPFCVGECMIQEAKGRN